MARQGINPVSIRGLDYRTQRKMAFAVSRMHVGVAGQIKKLVSICAYDDQEQPSEENIKAFLVADEEHFVGGMMHLFPAGELDRLEDAPLPIHTEMLDLLKEASLELTGETANKIRRFLERTGE